MAGAIHHVYPRGNNRAAVFHDERDRYRFLELLGLVTERQEWRLLAFCLMTNHVHLVIETPEPNLGEGMQRLLGRYARNFNDRHGRVGHVFHRPFGSVRVETEAQLASTIGYVVANPVAAGLCKRPESWKWSSHPATLGAADIPWLAVELLLSYLSAAWGGNPRRRYLELIEERLTALVV